VAGEDHGDWYRDFFHGLALELWRKAVTPEQTRREADFLVAALAPDGTRPLLDVPCGNGRHALELAARGLRVVGVDLAEEFIAEAKTQAGTLPVELVQGDMRQLPAGPFGGAYCLGNSFGYLPHEGTQEFLAAVARVLLPGARFVLHSGTVAECLLPSLVERREMQVQDVHMLSVNRYDAAASVLENEYTFTRGLEKQTGVARYHIYTAAELGRMVTATGLHVEAWYGSFERAPFDLAAPMLLLVAAKPAA
jgi:SAM-dependent methyltransferase